MRVDEFVDNTLNAESAEAVFKEFSEAVAWYGFDRLIYCSLGQAPAPAIISNYPEDWLKYYAEKGYMHTDPARLHCAVSRRPFLWSSVTATLPRDRLVIFNEAADAGVRDGIGIAIHEPSGETRGVALARSVGGDCSTEDLSKLHLMAMQFHLAYSEKLLAKPPDAAITLTAREREVLVWLAQGKSKWVVGEILGISEHAVSFHCRNIFRKLGVSSGRMAVLKAIQLGLIPLS